MDIQDIKPDHSQWQHALCIILFKTKAVHDWQHNTTTKIALNTSTSSIYCLLQFQKTIIAGLHFRVILFLPNVLYQLMSYILFPFYSDKAFGLENNRILIKNVYNKSLHRVKYHFNKSFFTAEAIYCHHIKELITAKD